jgi:hypothetical protein
MKNNIINTYDLDNDKKTQITMYALNKMLKEIKDSLVKHGKIKVIIEKAE